MTASFRDQLLPRTLLRAEFISLIAALAYVILLGIEVLIVYPEQRITTYYIATLSGIFIFCAPFALCTALLIGVLVAVFLRWIDIPWVSPNETDADTASDTSQLQRSPRLWLYGLFCVAAGSIPTLLLQILIQFGFATPIAGWYFLAPIGVIATAWLFFTERKEYRRIEHTDHSSAVAAASKRSTDPRLLWAIIIGLPILGTILFLWFRTTQ